MFEEKESRPGRGGGARTNGADSARSTAIIAQSAGKVKTIGQVRGDTFYKSARGSKHMLRKPRAWALDVSSLDDAKRAGATRVEIRDTETNNVYSAAIATIETRGFTFDRGFGLQIALALDRWQVNAPRVEQLALELESAGAP